MTLEEEFAYLAYDITDTWVYNGSYKIPSLPTADNYIINIHQNTFIDSTSSRLIDITADTQTYGDRNFPFVTIQGSEDATLSASISYTPYACITDNIYVVGAQNGWLNLDVPLKLQMNSPGESRATDSSWNAVEAYASGGVYLKKDVDISAFMKKSEDYGLQFSGLRVFGWQDYSDGIPSRIQADGNITIHDSHLSSDTGTLRFYGLHASLGEYLDEPLEITASGDVTISGNTLVSNGGDALATGIKAAEYSSISLNNLSMEGNSVTSGGNAGFIGIHSATDSLVTTSGLVDIAGNHAGRHYSLKAEGGEIDIASGAHRIEGDMTAVLGRLYEDNYGDLYHEASPILPGTVDMSTPLYENAGGIRASFSGADSFFSGFTSDGEALTDPSGTGQYASRTVSSISLAFTDHAVWNVIPSNIVAADARGSYVSRLTELSLDDADVYVGTTENAWRNAWTENAGFASSFATLSATDRPVELLVQNLSGSGNFYLRTDLQKDISDSVRITKSLSGSHKLWVKAGGSEPLVMTQTGSYLARTENTTAATGNEFSLKGGAVVDDQEVIDLGLYLYHMENSERNNGREWYLVRNVTLPEPGPENPEDSENETEEPETSAPLSPTGETEAALSGLAGHYAMWYGYQTDLRKRLGEVRYGTHTGLWVRGFADKTRLNGLGGTGLTQNLVGGSIGYDTIMDVDEMFLWIAGLQIRSGHADQDTCGRWGGYGELSSLGGSLYSTWVHADGWYLDAVATADWFHHEIRSAMLNGTKMYDDRSTCGLGTSLEVGRNMDFAFSNRGQDYWFLEPQLQLSWFWVKGGDFTSSNGMTIEQSDMASLTGRAGLVLGKKFSLEEKNGVRYVQPYVKAGVNHEFLGDQKARINGVNMRSDLDGTRVYYGLGADWQVTDNLRLYMQAEREHGENFTREYNVSAGLKWRF